VYILIIKKGKIFCKVKNKIKFVGVHAIPTGTDQLCRGAAPIFSIILIKIKYEASIMFEIFLSIKKKLNNIKKELIV